MISLYLITDEIEKMIKRDQTTLLNRFRLYLILCNYFRSFHIQNFLCICRCCCVAADAIPSKWEIGMDPFETIMIG